MVVLISIGAIHSVSIAEEKARRVGFLFEGTFESHEIARSAEGATKTLIVPFYEWDYGVRAFSKETWDSRRMNWEKLEKPALNLAEELVKKVKPDIVRDERGIVQYVILVDENPFLTSVVLSPKLRETYRDVLGDRIYALPLDRNRVYLFPVTGGALKDYGPAIVDEFRKARLPVSLEIFLLDESGYRAVGELKRSNR